MFPSQRTARGRRTGANRISGISQPQFDSSDSTGGSRRQVSARGFAEFERQPGTRSRNSQRFSERTRLPFADGKLVYRHRGDGLKPSSTSGWPARVPQIENNLVALRSLIGSIPISSTTSNDLRCNSASFPQSPHRPLVRATRYHEGHVCSRDNRAALQCHDRVRSSLGRYGTAHLLANTAVRADGSRA